MRMKKFVMINTEVEISDIRPLICGLRAKHLPQVDSLGFLNPTVEYFEQGKNQYAKKG